MPTTRRGCSSSTRAAQRGVAGGEQRRALGGRELHGRAVAPARLEEERAGSSSPRRSARRSARACRSARARSPRAARRSPPRAGRRSPAPAASDARRGGRPTGASIPRNSRTIATLAEGHAGLRHAEGARVHAEEHHLLPALPVAAQVLAVGSARVDERVVDVGDRRARSAARRGRGRARRRRPRGTPRRGAAARARPSPLGGDREPRAAELEGAGPPGRGPERRAADARRPPRRRARARGAAASRVVSRSARLLEARRRGAGSAAPARTPSRGPAHPALGAGDGDLGDVAGGVGEEQRRASARRPALAPLDRLLRRRRSAGGSPGPAAAPAPRTASRLPGAGGKHERQHGEPALVHAGQRRHEPGQRHLEGAPVVLRRAPAQQPRPRARARRRAQGAPGEGTGARPLGRRDERDARGAAPGARPRRRVPAPRPALRAAAASSRASSASRAPRPDPGAPREPGEALAHVGEEAARVAPAARGEGLAAEGGPDTEPRRERGSRAAAARTASRAAAALVEAQVPRRAAARADARPRRSRERPARPRRARRSTSFSAPVR